MPKLQTPVVELPVSMESVIATEAPAEQSAENSRSPKFKGNRGCPADWKTTWVSFDMSPEEHDRLMKVAKHRNVKINTLFVNLLKAAIAEQKTEFDNDAQAYELTRPVVGTGKKAKALTEMTESEIKAYLLNMQSELLAAQALVDNMRKLANPTAE